MTFAILATALASQPRCDILAILKSGSSTMGELAATLQLAPSTVSHHVAVLRRAGLVETSRVGREVLVETLVGHIELIVPPAADRTTPAEGDEPPA